MSRRQDPTIRDFILRNIEDHPDSVASIAADRFGLSRAGIARYMNRLLGEGLIGAKGNTRARRYSLTPLVRTSFLLQRNGRWNEDVVWREHVRPLMKNVKQNIIDLYQYGVTEMVNNVIDHSSSPDLFIFYNQTYASIEINVVDTGVGIFAKIQRDFKLDDPRTALLELSKGKLTSDKKHHSGEGIYFTSRMFDSFVIYSGHLFYSRIRQDGDDWLIEGIEGEGEKKGTYVSMKINTNADWKPRGIFDKYQGDDIYFRKTHIPISLGRYPGEQLVSRSQAKRILTRITDFSEVILDFHGVNDIGQPFADEIFRVFRSQHPGTELFALNTNSNIEQMIEYVQKDRTRMSSSGEIPST